MIHHRMLFGQQVSWKPLHLKKTKDTCLFLCIFCEALCALFAMNLATFEQYSFGDLSQ